MNKCTKNESNNVIYVRTIHRSDLKKKKKTKLRQ